MTGGLRRETQPDVSEQSRGERFSHVFPACAKTMRFCPSCEAVARSGSHQEDYRGCRPLPCGIRKECWDKKPQRCGFLFGRRLGAARSRSEEHTSELQSLMRISYAVFCLKKTNMNEQLLKYMIYKDYLEEL